MTQVKTKLRVFHRAVPTQKMMALAATFAALGVMTLNAGVTNQLRVHELRKADTKDVCDIRTAVFSPHLEAPYSKIVQGRAWEESMAEKTKVLVARATGELAATLKAANEFVGFAGDEDEPIIGTADLQLVPTPAGNCVYINNVCVDPCARKRGVARGIMDVVDTLAMRELGANALTLAVDSDNIPAIRLYERCAGREPSACFASRARPCLC
jgi:ribosomal protein S18 acetylase RimI-like enzyme